MGGQAGESENHRGETSEHVHRIVPCHEDDERGSPGHRNTRVDYQTPGSALRERQQQRANPPDNLTSGTGVRRDGNMEDVEAGKDIRMKSVPRPGKCEPGPSQEAEPEHSGRNRQVVGCRENSLLSYSGARCPVSLQAFRVK